MEIRGKIKVKVKVNEITNKTTFRTVLTNKKSDGETEFASLFINFAGQARDLSYGIQNDDFIVIQKGFLAFSNDENGKSIFKLIIQEFNFEESQKANANDIFGTSDDDDLPF